MKEKSIMKFRGIPHSIQQHTVKTVSFVINCRLILLYISNTHSNNVLIYIMPSRYNRAPCFRTEMSFYVLYRCFVLIKS